MGNGAVLRRVKRMRGRSPQTIECHKEGRRIQDGECVCDTWREKVPLQDVKLCPTWKVNEGKCPDL